MERISSILSTIIIILFLCLPAYSAVEYEAGPRKLIIHPDYPAANIYFGTRWDILWNLDYTRVLLWEGQDTSNSVTGRRFTTAPLQDLIDLEMESTDRGDSASRTAYDALVDVLPDQSHTAGSTNMTWSRYVGEEDIIYRTYVNGASGVKIQKIDVTDIGSGWTNIVTLAPSPTDTPQILGWTTDATPLIMVNANREVWGDGGWTVDLSVGSPSATAISSFFKNPCTGTTYQKYNVLAHGHHSRNVNASNNRLQEEDASCTGSGQLLCLLKVDYTEEPCASGTATEIITYTGSEIYDINLGSMSHYSFSSPDDDWFLGSWASNNLGSVEETLWDRPVYQVIINGAETAFSFNLLFTTNGAPRYNDGGGDQNYHAHPLVTLRADGNQLAYTTTDGRYGWHDFDTYDGVDGADYSNWGNYLLYVRDLVDPDADPVSKGKSVGISIGSFK